MGWVKQISKPRRTLSASDNKIRFVWSSDEHVGNADTDAQVLAVDLAVNDCNDWLPNAFISTGDVCGNNIYQLGRWFYHMWRCQRPVYLVMGNHDRSEYSPGSYGNPASVSGEMLMDREKTYYSEVLISGDGAVRALCLFLDCNFYADDPTPLNEPGNSLYHSAGDAIGASDITPGGGFYKMFPQEELDWITATLAADVLSDYVLVFMHYQPRVDSKLTNQAALADVLQADSRPIIGFCGHDHGNALVCSLATTDALRTFNFYKVPSLQESGAWCRVTLGWNGSAIAIDGMELYHYTDPGEWTVNAPFTVA